MRTSLRRSLAVGTTAALALTGLVQAAPPAAAVPAANATKAANFIVRNLPSTGDGAGASMTAALALATTENACSYAPTLRTLVKQVEKNAKSYLYPGKKLNQARAANLAITVKALGLNPSKFAGYNLTSLVTKSLPKDGQVGPSKSAFSQSLGIIALKRAGATIPVTLLTNLLGQQGDNGAFGYEFPAGTFNADPDTTAMGILALKSLGHLDPQLDKAEAWAKAEQEPAGYWQNYSPVDSTGLLGSALKKDSAEVTKAKDWLATVQHADGGFPNSLDDDTASDVTATGNALYLITGRSLLDVSLNLGKCPSPPKLPKSTTSCTGVWVVVDRGNGQQTVRCATKHSTGLAALKSAGFSTGTTKDGFVNRIQGFPVTLDTTFSKYWGYWSATPKADGTWNAWTSYGVGAAGSKPVKGSAEGWVYGPYPGDNVQPELDLPPLGYAAAAVPAISGTAKVGKTLTAAAGSWDPQPSSFGYRWYRSGKAISKATKATYKLTSSDAGKTITVKVTAKKDGYQSVSKTSKATAKVRK